MRLISKGFESVKRKLLILDRNEVPNSTREPQEPFGYQKFCYKPYFEVLNKAITIWEGFFPAKSFRVFSNTLKFLKFHSDFRDNCSAVHTKTL